MPHTPGPWQAKLGRSMAFDVSIVNDEGHIVARTSESNGPLIAAAPELLEALRDIVETCEANMLHSDTIRADSGLPRGPQDEAMYQRVRASTERARIALLKMMDQPR